MFGRVFVRSFSQCKSCPLRRNEFFRRGFSVMSPLPPWEVNAAIIKEQQSQQLAESINNVNNSTLNQTIPSVNSIALSQSTGNNLQQQPQPVTPAAAAASTATITPNQSLFHNNSPLPLIFPPSSSNRVPLFNTYKLVDRLRAAGLTEQQSVIFMEALLSASSESFEATASTIVIHL